MSIVLITGADGFIGSHLTDYFLESNYKVIAIKKPGTHVKNLMHLLSDSSEIQEIQPSKGFKEIPTIYPDLNFLECDLTDKEMLENIILEFKPNIILHFGAQSLVLKSWEDPKYTFQTNVIGTINIFETIKRHNIKSRIIVACSSAEYGTTTKLNRPLKEDDPLLAVHPYGISKVAVDLLSRQYYINFGIDSINLRLFNQTGPRKTDDACSDFVREIVKIELGLKRPEIQVGNLNTYRDITGIQDTIQAINLAVSNGRSGETYNVCSNRKIQIREILNIVLNFSSKKIKVKEQFKEKLRKTDEDIILGDNNKIKKELGWNISIPLETVLKQMYDYWMDIYKNS